MMNHSSVDRLAARAMGAIGILCLAACAGPAVLPPAPAGTWLADVEIANPSRTARPAEEVYLSYQELGAAATNPAWPKLRITRNGAAETFQWADRNGDGDSDGILLHLKLAAAERSVLHLVFDARQPAVERGAAVVPTPTPRADGQPPALRTVVKSAHATAQKKAHGDAALYWATRLADSELQRRGLVAPPGAAQPAPPRFPYSYDTSGLLPMAFASLARATGDARYQAPLRQITASSLAQDDSIISYSRDSFNIDNVAPGVAFLELFNATGEERFRKAAATLREQLVHHPRTSQGAFWHKQRYPSQLWLDGVYMGMPFLARYSRQFEQGSAYQEVVIEFVVAREHLLDPKTGLYFHAWDEAHQQDWADPATGRSRHFWGRGLGWFAMALVDVLDILPPDRMDLRQPLLQMARELAPSLVAVQDKERGTWWQVLDKPGQYGNYLESSASSMFTYFLAKGVNRGYLDSKYAQVARRAYAGMVRDFILVDATDAVSLGSNCQVAGLGYGRDGSYDYYISEPVVSNDPKAVARSCLPPRKWPRSNPDFKHRRLALDKQVDFHIDTPEVRSAVLPFRLQE
jgi:rhamnogalacturonyl hydrolase YesR